jgi:hypothetical protein
MACDKDPYKRIKQWLWFIGLWIFGILVMSILASAIKGLIHFM